MRSAACIFFKRRGAAAAYAHTHNTLLLRSSTTAHQHALDAEVAELGLLRARQHARAVAARLVKVGLDGRPVVGDRAKRDGAVAHHDVDVDLGPVEVLLCACVCVRVCVGGDVVGVLGLGLCAIQGIFRHFYFPHRVLNNAIRFCHSLYTLNYFNICTFIICIIQF